MLIDLATAKAHARIDGSTENALIGLYIDAAEQSAAQFLNRKLYGDDYEMTQAKAAAPAKLTAATAAYEAAIAAAELLPNAIECAYAKAVAEKDYTAAQTDYRETMDGIVVNEAITAAILLIFGDLYAAREDTVIGTGVVVVASLPFGSRALLQPYRAGMGV